MGARDRLVRRVRLAADSEEAVRHMLPRLEDALRCASLPDDSNRVLVVRKLALGPIAHDCSVLQLSGLIERRVADLGARWQDGGSAQASAADFVRFRNPLEARMVLVRRLVRGDSCSAWYWPLAVKEFRRGDTLRETMRRVTAEIARWPEAAVALPAWAAGVAEAGALAALAASFSADEGAALLQWAGIGMRPGLDTIANESGAVKGAAQKPREESTTPALQGNNTAPVPHWLAALLQVAGVSTPDASVRMRGVAPGAAVDGPDVPHAQHARVVGPELTAGSRYAQSPAEDRNPPTGADEGLAFHRALKARSSEANDVSGAEIAARVADGQAAQAWLAPTQCGGLPFLLPVLQCLDLPKWCANDQACAAFARRVLAAALLRLRVPAEDLAWSITQSHTPVDLPAVAAPAPAVWSDEALRAAASPRSIALGQALVLATSVDQQAQIWLTAVRRWLRRRAGIGLASLVLRPARLDHTATHLHMHFGINDVDMRVRRLGLDSDPGWLPWFGQVVTYHYQDQEQGRGV